MSVGDNIKKARQDAGYNQDELAEAVGVTRNTISRWERNRTSPTVEELKKVSTFLGADFNVSEGEQNESVAENQVLVDEIKTLAMNLEDIRLDMISVNQMKLKIRRTITLVIIIAILVCVIIIGIFITLINWPAYSDNQPIRIEYIEEGEK